MSNFNSANFSKRNIIHQRAGETNIIDILSIKYNLDNFNPFLMEGDKIYFQEINETIYIDGALSYPGFYEYKSDETLEDIINIAGGFVIDADSSNIEIMRFINNDEQLILNINNLNLFKNTIMKPSDHIVVKYKKNFKDRNIVKIYGEINTPGHYVYEDNMTFSDLLERAGGYTKFADSSKIIIKNENFSKIRDEEYERIELIPPQNRSVSEISYLKSK